MGILQDAQVQLTPQSVVGSGRILSLSEIITCKNEENPIKNDGARVGTTFSPL